MKRLLALPGAVAALLVAPLGTAVAGAEAPPGLSVYAASAEAWAYSAEIGIPGALGPFASHTTAAVDNTPRAAGATGLADPGFLVRAAGELIAGVPTPLYCESAWPEGPETADCGGPPAGGAHAAQLHTGSGAGPNSASTATASRVALGEGPVPVMVVEAQSTTSETKATAEGVSARAEVVLSGVSLGGGALRLDSVRLSRQATADATHDRPATSTTVTVAGISIAGQTVDPGRDTLPALAEAARQALGDSATVTALDPVERTDANGALLGETAGLLISWQPAPDRWAKVVLGYVRTLVYAVPGAQTAVELGAGAGSDRPVVPPAVAEAPAPTDGGAAPTPLDGSPTLANTATGSSVSERFAALAPAGRLSSATPSDPGSLGSTDNAAPAQGGTAAAGTASTGPPTVPTASRPLQQLQARPVQWVSPFIVLADWTTGRQLRWFLLALVPLVLGTRAWRRIAPRQS